MTNSRHQTGRLVQIVLKCISIIRYTEDGGDVCVGLMDGSIKVDLTIAIITIIAIVIAIISIDIKAKFCPEK